MASIRTRFPLVLPLLVAALAMPCGPSLLSAQGFGARAAAPDAPSVTVEARADSAAMNTVVERFHSAIAAGDAAAALSLLTDDAVIVENGRAETKERYHTLHLPNRMAFARTLQTERKVVRTEVRGDVGWVSAIGTARQSYQGRPVTATGTELMVLTRTPAGWRIAEIHWSAQLPGTR